MREINEIVFICGCVGANENNGGITKKKFRTYFWVHKQTADVESDVENERMKCALLSDCSKD